MRLGGDGQRLGGQGSSQQSGEDLFSCDELPLNCDRPLENPLVIGSGALGLLLCGLLAVCSICAVPPLFYGLRYNYFTKWADIEHVYTPGRYFVGPWSTLVLFPSDVQRVEFTKERRLKEDGSRFPPLHTRTKEGLALHLQVSLQYRLTKEKLGQLYDHFNTKYEDLFFSTIRDTLIQVASDYEASELWQKRQQVGESMQQTLNEKLGSTFAECWGLQLLDIELPDSFDNAIVKTQVQRQNRTTMGYAQQAIQIHAKTDVIKSEYEKQVTIKKATGTSNYTRTTKIAKANATSNTLRIETEVVGNVKQRLGLVHDEIVQYQQCAAVKTMGNASLFFGFQPDTQMLINADKTAATPVAAAPEAPAKPVERRLSGDAGEDIDRLQAWRRLHGRIPGEL